MVKKDEATKRCAAKGSEELYSALLSKSRRGATGDCSGADAEIVEFFGDAER